MALRAVIFDLDGTLVDSALDFDLMRREMGLEGNRPILETLDSLPPEESARLWEIVARHELQGVHQAQLFPGVRDLLHELAARGIKRGLLTRNSRGSTLATLARFDLELDYIVSREDGPVKPDPAGILRMCAHWDVLPSECVMVGDYYFDIEAGRRAGTRTVLFLGAGKAHGMPAEVAADFELRCFGERTALWKWLSQIDLEGSGGCC